jgi:hypothetical protein
MKWQVWAVVSNAARESIPFFSGTCKRALDVLIVSMQGFLDIPLAR